jgi:hypothetical protein
MPIWAPRRSRWLRTLMDPISTAFVAPIERDVQAQTKDARRRTWGYLLRVLIFGNDSNVACTHRTNNSIRTRDAAGARAQRCPGAATGPQKLMWVRIAEAEREVTALDLPLAAARPLSIFSR